MTNPDALLSIRELAPIESGGREARIGFVYQDHVAVSFCLDLLCDDSLIEVWCEAHDDITLIWTENSTDTVEFVQVKASDLTSRWSVATLCERAKKNAESKTDGDIKTGGGADMQTSKKDGSSILEQSLVRARCKEPVKFRMVTRIDVNNELSPLKLDLNHPDRTQEVIVPLQTEIRKRLPGAVSLSGIKCCDWAEKCVWDIRESEEALANSNKLKLERFLSKEGREMSPDHREDLYQHLLAYVQHASKVEREVEPYGYKITEPLLRNKITEKLDSMGYGSTTSIPLDMTVKMSRCGISQEAIENASDLRRAYKMERLAARYMTPATLRDAEVEVTSILQRLLAGLDSGRLNDSGLAFHDRCLQALAHLEETWPDGTSRPRSSVLQGYMYERTDRCVHRFDRPPA